MPRTFIRLLIVMLGLLSVAAQADPDLPLLGEEAPQMLQKEGRLGHSIYRQLADRGLVIEDPLLTDYLSGIGSSLLASLDRRLREYRFFLVADDTVNAFAAPGGYIGVHLGMIEQLQSESELAAVLAHEIAHVRLRHGLQMIEKADRISWLTLLGIANAVLLGSRDPDAAMAAIALTQAGSAQSMINFTRGNEYEADRVGLKLLQDSEYDPWAMADLMALLQRKERRGELAQIEYLRTHPINANRLAEVHARLPQDRKTLRRDRFSQFRDYLFHLYPLRSARRPGGRFAQALGKMEEGRLSEAGALFEQLIDEDPDSIWYRSAAADNLLRQHRPREAKAAYRSLLELYPGHVGISLRLAEVLLTQQRLDEAARLLERLRHERSADPGLYALLIRLYKLQGRDLDLKLAQADYHWLKGDRELAVKQYRRLLDAADLPLQEREKIEEKLALEKAAGERS